MISKGDQNRLAEQIGIGYILARAGELGYLIRSLKEHDKGIDAQMEITHRVNLPSKILGLQIKARSECYINKNKEITINVTKQNLDHWRNECGKPVIMMVYQRNTNEIYWTRVDKATSTSIKISTQNKFDKESLPKLIKIIYQYNGDKALGIKLATVNEVIGDFGETVSDVLETIQNKVLEANMLAENGEYSSSTEIFYHLASIYDKPNLWFNFGYCLCMDGQYDKCLDQLELKENQYEDFWKIKNLRALCYSMQGDYEKAELRLCQARDHDPCNPDWRNNLGLVYYWQGKDLEAFQELEIALDLNNRDPEVLFNLALCATALERYNEAIKYYSECTCKAPYFYDAYNNQGLLLKFLWRFDEALELFKYAIQIDSSNYKALVNCAFLLKDLDQNEQAIQYFNLALDNLDNDETRMEIFRALALLYCRIGEVSKYTFYFDKCFEVMVNNNPRKYFNGKIAYIDVGYEAVYAIRLFISPQSIKIEDVFRMNEITHSLREISKIQSSLGLPNMLMKNEIAKMVDIEKRNPINAKGNKTANWGQV